MRVSVFLCWVIGVGLVSGCGPNSRMGSGNGGGDDDAGVTRMDLAFRDAAPTSGPDLAYPGKLFHFVTDSVRFPQSIGEYGFAPNHDGAPHNQFARVALALFQNGIPLQPSETVGITIDGDALELLSVASMDASLTGDPNSFVNVYVASAARQPDLSGAGSFTINLGAGKGTLPGNLAGGTFYGGDPANAAAPPTAPLRIALAGSQRVTLPLVGAHLTFIASPDGLMKGEIHGALKQDDLDKIFIPSLAQNLSLIATQQNCAQNADCTNVRKLFDTQPTDGMISALEVKGSLLLSNLLGPDVDLYDAQGKWKPNPSNTSPDSFTIGVGFTAKKAMFSE